MERFIYFGKDKYGNIIISGEGHRMTYIGYTEREAKAKFRKQFNLERRHIVWCGV